MPDERVAIFPGSFDPITLGHVDVVGRATALFDRVIIAVLVNAAKSPWFSVEERIAFNKKQIAVTQQNLHVAQAELGARLEQAYRTGDIDLVTTLLEDLGARLTAVEITELHEGTFFAELEIAHGDRTVRLSARPSDAMALAVRQPEPVRITVADEVIDEAGLHFDAEEDEEQIEEFREFLDQISPEDFV